MSLNPAWLTPAYFIIGYLLYWFAPELSIFQRLSASSGKTAAIVSRNKYYTQKSLGFLLLGPGTIAAAAIWGPVTENRFGFQWPSGSHALLWFLLSSGIAVLIMSLRSEKSFNHEYYPQVRLKQWKPVDILMNSLFWILYLLSYEFAFRGLMFFPLLEILGFWPAAIIGTVIYSCVHIPKGAQEAISAIPFGILLYYIAMDTSSMLIPFIIHLILALMNDYRSLKANPQMSIKWTG
ncbi:MAG: CPBP family intramembrane metalloprotease [Spirochaetaceae bacterium]|nr:CPBP family intramembrane metalloprotease [Spirochaetaceae bacterium]